MFDNHTQRIVNKAWSFAHLLRDDGLSYMEYTEQITFLLFLKMAHERTRPPWSQAPIVPDGLDWPSLLAQGSVAGGRRELAGTEPAQHRFTRLRHPPKAAPGNAPTAESRSLRPSA